VAHVIVVVAAVVVLVEAVVVMVGPLVGPLVLVELGALVVAWALGVLA